jgi:hypothetical protein
MRFEYPVGSSKSLFSEAAASAEVKRTLSRTLSL